MCKIFGNHWSQERKKFLRGTENLHKGMASKNGELNQRSRELEVETRNSTLHGLDVSQYAKRRRITDAKVWEAESEQEEHSLSLSQHSSPSQSDQEQNTVQKFPTSSNDSILPSQQFVHLKVHQKTTPDVHFVGGESPRPPKTEQFLRIVPPPRQEAQFLAADQKTLIRPSAPPPIGADVRGTVDGAFDSGYLMTATVNGQILRGVLFAPGPGIVAPRPTIQPQSPLVSPVVVSQHCSAPAHGIPVHLRPPPHSSAYGCGHLMRQVRPAEAVKSHSSRINDDLQGVVLTLGGLGGGSSPGGS